MTLTIGIPLAGAFLMGVGSIGLVYVHVIMFLQKLAKNPNASAINMAFTKHITNALMQVREEKLKHEASIPRKL